MANKFENIRKALTTPMAAVLPGIDKVFPNQSYTPDPQTPYMAYFMLRNQPSASTLGAAGQDVHTGTFQISLYYPKSSGDIAMLQAADEIETTYQQYVRGGYLSSGGVSVRITSVGLGTANADNAWFFTPININYESYIKGVI